MSTAGTIDSQFERLPTGPGALPQPPKAWPAVAIVGVYWGAYLAIGLLEATNFSKFLMRLPALGGLVLLFFAWWLRQRGVPRRERWGLLAVTIVLGAAAMFMLHRSVVPPSVIFLALPAMITAWTVWLVVVRSKPARIRRLGMLAIAGACWAATLLVRMDGLSGDTTAKFHWRWSPSGEDRFLLERASVRAIKNDAPLADSATPLAADDSDWPTFRGDRRDGAVHGVKIATDWNESPPKQLWKRRVGPGWSSIVVVGDRLFTQEQRGDQEAVVCFDAATGQEMWSHEDPARFSETLGGDGPRATPTFDAGRLHALGATGILNSFDAASGKLQWSRDIAKDAGAAIPQWGFSSSPLAVGGLVIVFAGGEGEKNLLAYRADSGEPAWDAQAGKHSYSSPQMFEINGEEQVLFVSDSQLVAINPATGSTRWSFDAGYQRGQPSIQPHAAGAAELLASFTPDAGIMLLDVSRADQDKIELRWKSTALKPFFNDFVLHEDSIYGFDGEIFCCVDRQTGKRKWKKGRYGAGQVLLLADQPVLLVISESGEAVLVAADPKKHRELGRFQAIEGKTWNHPTIVDGRLYLRNAEEMACYELALLE